MGQARRCGSSLPLTSHWPDVSKQATPTTREAGKWGLVLCPVGKKKWAKRTPGLSPPRQSSLCSILQTSGLGPQERRCLLRFMQLLGGGGGIHLPPKWWRWLLTAGPLVSPQDAAWSSAPFIPRPVGLHSCCGTGEKEVLQRLPVGRWLEELFLQWGAMPRLATRREWGLAGGTSGGE